MSYCRWSSNNWDCDLYCYESEDGYTTHVASYRKVGATPIPQVDVQLLLSGRTAEYWAGYKAQNEWLKTAERVKIGLPYDGRSFDDETLEEFLERVTMLRDAGYHVPPWLIDDIREEMQPRPEAE